MTKRKRNRNNTPRRKRFNRKQRLDSARSWLATYDGGNIAKEYRKRFGVDWTTAFIELEMLGIKVDPDYKRQVFKSRRGHAEAKKRKREQKASQTKSLIEDYQDENFAYIAGYTNWGFPYGVTWQEWEEAEHPKVTNAISNTTFAEKCAR